MGDIMVVAFALIVGDAGKEKSILEFKSMKEVRSIYCMVNMILLLKLT